MGKKQPQPKVQSKESLTRKFTKERLTTHLKRCLDMIDAGTGSYTEESKRVMQIFERGLKRKKAKAEDAENEIAVDEFVKLPDWETDNNIANTVELVKDVDGNRQRRVCRVYYNDAKPKMDYVTNRFVPETAMQPEDVNLVQVIDLASIYRLLRERQFQFLYFSCELHYDLLALGATSSYFREAFNTFPYYDFISGTFGSGKTTSMKCLIWSSYNGYIMLSPTLAVLFRSIEDTKAAIGIDEIDNLFKDWKSNRDILNLLDSGHTKGIPAYRMNMDVTPPEVVPYDPFGLKAWTRTGLIPRSLISRAITIQMIENKGFKAIRSDPLPETFKDIRAQLYNYRLRAFTEVKASYDELQLKDLEIYGRSRDIFLPLLTIAKLIDLELYASVLKYAKQEGEQKDLLKNDIVITTLVDILLEGSWVGDQKVVTLRDLLNDRLKEKGELREKDRPYSSQQVETKLTALGFQKSRKRAQGYAHYTITKELLEQLRLVYVDSQDKLPLPAEPHQTSPNLTKMKTTEDADGESTSSHPKQSPGEVSEVGEVVKGGPHSGFSLIHSCGTVIISPPEDMKGDTVSDVCSSCHQPFTLRRTYPGWKFDLKHVEPGTAIACPTCGFSMTIMKNGDKKTAFHNCESCGRRLMFDVETGEVLKASG